jgi:hypothetical protein
LAAAHNARLWNVAFGTRFFEQERTETRFISFISPLPPFPHVQKMCLVAAGRAAFFRGKNLATKTTPWAHCEGCKERTKMTGFTQLLAMLAGIILGIALLVLKKVAPGNKFAAYVAGLIFVALSIRIARWRKWKLNLGFFVLVILTAAVLVLVLI